jgi:hypothetical protein
LRSLSNTHPTHHPKHPSVICGINQSCTRYKATTLHPTSSLHPPIRHLQIFKSLSPQISQFPNLPSSHSQFPSATSKHSPVLSNNQSTVASTHLHPMQRLRLHARADHEHGVARDVRHPASAYCAHAMDRGLLGERERERERDGGRASWQSIIRWAVNTP